MLDEHSCEQIKDVRVVKGNQLLEQKMGLFHAVGRTAQSEPRCIVVKYEGDPDSDKSIALVGKGVTYDTGGLNLKPTGYMEDMYGDKNGACAVIGALKGVLESKPKLNIVFAVGLAENAIGSQSYKPGDILTSMKGLTVEIGNTDAEGRLVLADTFTYVQKEFKVSKLIDLATLTGAIKVALGSETAGFFSNDDAMAAALEKSSKNVFEAVWRMPIMDEHRDSMKSSFADLNNKGKTPYGGSSQAAAFLEKFIDKEVKWIHLDIAGPAMLKSAKPPMCADGTGFGAQLLLDYVWSESEA